MQADLDEHPIRYNTKRSHQGLDMRGKTPYPYSRKYRLK